MRGGRRRSGDPRLADRVSREVDEELSFHIESRVRDLMSEGRSREEAEAQALAEFGDRDEAREELVRLERSERRLLAPLLWLADLATDLRLAARGMGRRPQLTAALLLTLALGIGSTAAIYTVVDAALLSPLPYDDADRLVHLWVSHQEGTDLSEASYPDFLDWRGERSVFAGLEGYDPTNRTVTTEAGSTMVRGARVTAGFFRLLGVEPALGRDFRPGEDDVGGTPVVLLSDRYWRRETGADPTAVGRTLVIDGAPHEIIGIAPPGFHFAPAGDAELWLPVNEGPAGRADRSRYWLNVVGRLADGVTVPRAQDRLDVVMEGLARSWPDTNRGRGVRVVELREEIVGPLRPVLLVLFAAVGLLLLVACVNVGGLLLTRVLARSRELALRGALGATASRLARQLLAEGCLLAALGALLGLALARVGVRLLVGAAPATVFEQLPVLHEAAPDARVIVFTAAVTGLAGLAFGFVPMLVARTPAFGGLARSLVTLHFVRLRDLLAGGQLAFTVALLIGSGLVGRSLLHLLAEEPGFRSEQVFTARVALAGASYAEDGAQRRFFEELLSRLRALPGVREAGAVTDPPSAGGAEVSFRVEGEPEPAPGARPRAARRGIAGDYLLALGVPLLEGRVLTDGDDAEAPLVVLINESLARKLFPAGEALGRELSFYDFRPGPWRIVGIVGDVKNGRLDAPPTATVYYSHLQAAENRLTVVARTATDATELAARVRAEVRDLDPGVPVYDARTLEQLLGESPAVFVRRYPLVLIGTFAGVALVLGVIGVHGVVAQSVAQRRRELGVRAALGASPGRLFRIGFGHGTRLALAGALAGALLGWAFARALGSVLYGVPPTDPAVFGGAALLVALSAMLASARPALRAAALDPASALRAE